MGCDYKEFLVEMDVMLTNSAVCRLHLINIPLVGRYRITMPYNAHRIRIPEILSFDRKS